MKKICFLTTSRADFGTFYNLILQSINKKSIISNIIILGDHTEKKNSEYFEKKLFLSKQKKIKIRKFNFSQNNINNKEVNNTFSKIIKLIGIYLNKIKPDIFVVFGDRFEMFAGAISAYILGVPIVHIAGGEVSAGSLDDGFRHSITKLSSLHFPTSNTHRKRILQLGEKPETVFNYGSLNVEKIIRNNYLNTNQLEKKLKLKFKAKNLLMTYHPETIDEKQSLKNTQTLLNSLKLIKNTNIIITAPNKDAQGVIMEKMIKKFIKKNKLKNFRYFETLGSQTYLSLLKCVDGVIGNSSSGLSEVPMFGIGTINIGDRQLGRSTSPSVINCKVNKNEIIKSINKILSNKFKAKMNKNKIFNKKTVLTSKMIMRKILNFKFHHYRKKIFYDIF